MELDTIMFLKTDVLGIGGINDTTLGGLLFQSTRYFRILSVVGFIYRSRSGDSGDRSVFVVPIRRSIYEDRSRIVSEISC